MSTHSIRLGSTLTFNKEKEADIIQKIEYLTGKHKLGEFISGLLRIAFDSPSKLESQQKIQAELREIEQYNISKGRRDYFADIAKQMDEMKLKVDKMYDMNMKLLCLAELGKAMGLEDKTRNSLRAQFMVEHQLNELCNILGVDNLNHVFESSKMLDTENKSKEILEHILNTYDGIVQELKRDIFSQIELNLSNIQLTGVVSNQAILDNKQDDNEEIAEQQDNQEEVVEFNGADLSAITSMLGGSL